MAQAVAQSVAARPHVLRAGGENAASRRCTVCRAVGNHAVGQVARLQLQPVALSHHHRGYDVRRRCWSKRTTQNAAAALTAQDSEREAVAAAVTVREVDTDGELEQAASLRAEAYYEDQVHNRFVDSFKKQFMEQESRCVRGRIHERRKLNFACLVAMHEDRGLLDGVVGTADVRVPSREEALPSAYISNVCVDVDSRRLGVASMLLDKCFEVAAAWGLEEVYAHVEECNDGARSCYAANGFVEVPQTAAAVGRKGGKGGRRGGGKGGELSAAELLGTTTILLRRGL